MRLQVWAWRCEFCAKTWLAGGIDPPAQCSKCKRRGWHTKGASVKVEVVDQATNTIYLTEATDSNLGIPPVEIMPTEPLKANGRHYYEPMEDHVAPTYGGIARGAYPSIAKPDMQALRDICAGKIEPRNKEEFLAGFGHAMATGTLLKQELQPMGFYERSEVPICGKKWWEDGEHYECLMEAGLHAKHGLRGMVRRLD